MHEYSNMSRKKFLALKAENSKLEENNAYLRKLFCDLMTEQTLVKNHNEVTEFKA